MRIVQDDIVEFSRTNTSGIAMKKFTMSQYENTGGNVMARAAKAKKPKKEVSMEEALWKSADKLRGSVEPAEYKHVVLSLFFLKFASDKFETQRKMIAEKYGDKFVDNVAFYT